MALYLTWWISPCYANSPKSIWQRAALRLTN